MKHTKENLRLSIHDDKDYGKVIFNTYEAEGLLRYISDPVDGDMCRELVHRVNRFPELLKQNSALLEALNTIRNYCSGRIVSRDHCLDEIDKLALEAITDAEKK